MEFQRNKYLNPSWNQNNSNETNVDEIKETNILNLSDDCLMRIFSYLTVRERFKIERVCQRFYFVLSSYPWTDIIQLWVDMPLWGYDFSKEKGEVQAYIMSQLLPLCGNSLFSFCPKGIEMPENMLNYIGEICPNLECLEFGPEHRLSAEIIKSIANNCNKLEYINFSCKEDVEDYHLSELMFSCEKLEEILLYDSPKITGEFLLSAQENLCLRSIDISNCDSISPGFISKALAKFENLYELHLNNNLRLDIPFFSYNSENDITSLPLGIEALYIPFVKYIDVNVVPMLANLDSLDISGAEIEDNFLFFLTIRCPNIRSLNISHCRKITDIGVKAVTRLPELIELYVESLPLITDDALKHMSNLMLFFCSQSNNISDAGLITLIEKNSELSYLAAIRCEKITEDLIARAATAVKQRTNGVRLTINVSTSILCATEHENLKVVMNQNPFKRYFIAS